MSLSAQLESRVVAGRRVMNETNRQHRTTYEDRTGQNGTMKRRTGGVHGTLMNRELPVILFFFAQFS